VCKIIKSIHEYKVEHDVVEVELYAQVRAHACKTHTYQLHSTTGQLLSDFSPRVSASLMQEIGHAVKSFIERRSILSTVTFISYAPTHLLRVPKKCTNECAARLQHPQTFVFVEQNVLHSVV
jgi:hypothetical protein